MKKVFLFFICAGIILTNLFAAGGSLSGEKDIRVVKTEWFDIIYPKRSERTAKLLYEKADQLYYEVTEQYGLKPSFRMPVVIAPGVEKINAYWTISPYNHIVIYDTSSVDVDDLNVFSETFYNVFRHELTHAVTYNMKNGFWKALSFVFGDVTSPGYFLINSGIAEGAAVTSESSKGEGRLNDEYAKQYVKQAKIEDSFPNFYDVIGSRDIVPVGAAYHFNSAFHQYLQEKYGLDAYAKFWYNVVNQNAASLDGCFKKAFKVTLKVAWKQFIKHYEIPSIPANPVEAGLVKDFFNNTDSDYSIYNKSGSMFSSLTYSSRGLFWIDPLSECIQYVAKEDLDQALQNGSPLKPKTFLTHSRLSSISFSPDDRFLLISYISDESATVKSCLKLYDFETQSLLKLKETGLKSPALLMSGDDYYLVADKYDSLINQTFIAKVEISKGKKISLEDEKVIDLPYTCLKSNYTYFTEGQFACIKKTGRKYELCISDLDGNELALYPMPDEDMVVRSLSVDKGNLYFSWASAGTMPRLGKLDTSNGQFELWNQDLSGGVYDPINLGEFIVYTGVFYRQNRLLLLPAQNDFPKQTSSAAVAVKTEKNLTESNADFLSFLDDYELDSKKFNSFNYLRRGILIPASLYKTAYFGKNASYASDASNSFLGLTYMTGNPWTSGANDLFVLTGGWNYLNGATGIEFLSQKGTDTSLFSSTLDGQAEFDKEGFKLAYGKLNLGFTYPVGNHSYVGISNTVEGGYGRQDARNSIVHAYHQFFFWDQKYKNILAPADDKKYYTVQDVVTLKYTNVHKAGPARMEKAGVTMGLSFGYRKDESVENKPVTYIDSFALTGTLKGYIPRILPISCKNGFVYNLPTRIDFTLLPSSSILGYGSYSASDAGRVVFDFATETVLYGLELQRAIPFISWLYANDLYVSAGYALSAGAAYFTQPGFQGAHLMTYAGNLMTGRGCYMDSLYLKFSLEFTSNCGPFANPNFKIAVFGMTSFSLRKDPKTFLQSNIGIQASF